MDAYDISGLIGGGAFGSVYRAYDRIRSRPVALKKVRCDWSRQESSGRSAAERATFPPRVLRELLALRHMEPHVNVVRLLDYCPNASGLVLVLEFMQTNLKSILQCVQLSEEEQKAFLSMMFRGVAHIHSIGLMHRDLKPDNLLVGDGGVLKIGDFGLCRLVQRDKPMDTQVGSRWYRAPEVLFGSQYYDEKIDIWSAGCVVIEVLTSYPLFISEDDIGQAVSMLRIFGNPNERTWPDFERYLPDINKVIFDVPESPERPLDVRLEEFAPDTVAFAVECLRMHPDKRISASDALEHAYFHAFPPCCRLANLPPSETSSDTPDITTAPLSEIFALESRKYFSTLVARQQTSGISSTESAAAI